MDSAQQKIFEEVLDVFSTAGWKHILEDFSGVHRALSENMYRDCITNDDFQFRKGSLVELDRLLSYENTIRMTYEQMQNEAEYDSAAED